MSSTSSARRRRPMTTTVLHILLSLAEGPRHGYGIKKEVEDRTGGSLRVGPGTLYEAIGRLEERGLIQETSPDRDPEESHAQRRYYALTSPGRACLVEELKRLEDIVRYARQANLLPEPA